MSRVWSAEHIDLNEIRISSCNTEGISGTVRESIGRIVDAGLSST